MPYIYACICYNFLFVLPQFLRMYLAIKLEKAYAIIISKGLQQEKTKYLVNIIICSVMKSKNIKKSKCIHIPKQI